MSEKSKMQRLEIKGISGKTYPAVRLFDERIGEWVVVSVEELEEELIGEDNCFVSAEAERIDSGIYFYATSEVLAKSEEEIWAFLDKNT